MADTLAILATGVGLLLVLVWASRPMKIDRRRDVHTLQLHRRRRPTVRVAPRAGRKRR